MAEYKGYQGPMRIPSNAGATWGGRITVPVTTGTDFYTFSNTYVFNSDAIILATPQDFDARHMVASSTGVSWSCTDQGSLICSHGQGLSGNAVFHVAVFVGPGTAVTLA